MQIRPTTPSREGVEFYVLQGPVEIDIVAGGTTVILAMGAGRRAARAIGAYLQDREKAWPPAPETIEAFVPPAPLPQPQDPVPASA